MSRLTRPEPKSLAGPEHMLEILAYFDGTHSTGLLAWDPASTHKAHTLPEGRPHLPGGRDPGNRVRAVFSGGCVAQLLPVALPWARGLSFREIAPHSLPKSEQSTSTH